MKFYCRIQPKVFTAVLLAIIIAFIGFSGNVDAASNVGSWYAVGDTGKFFGSSRFCVISLTYIGLIDLCVLCVSVVRPTPSPARLYLRIHFTHQTGESHFSNLALHFHLWESEKFMSARVIKVATDQQKLVGMP